MRRGPGRLVSLFNALRDFVISDRVIPDEGFRVNETVNGRRLSLSQSILELARQYEEARSGSPEESATNGGTTITNIFQSGGSGTGLPDTGTDSGGNPTDPDGNPLAWRELNVCVSDGEGGWTPATLSIYAGQPAS
jgi:hypothetical protein